MIKRLRLEFSTLNNENGIFIRVYNRGSEYGFRDEHPVPHFHIEIPATDIILSVKIKDLSIITKHSFVQYNKPKDWSQVPGKIKKFVFEWLDRKVISINDVILTNYQYVGYMWNMENNYNDKEPNYVWYMNLKK
jgi:hypothetical protein